jgi:hypothetical protein
MKAYDKIESTVALADGQPSTTYIPLSGDGSSVDAALFAQEQEYYLHTLDINKNTQILTTLDNFSIGGTADFNNDKVAQDPDDQNPQHQTLVIGEELTILGPFTANHLTVCGIITSKDTSSLDVSGDPIPPMPPAATGDGNPGAKGNPGGTIQLFSEQLIDPFPAFHAGGGQGQNGQIASNGTDGDAGNGGDAGDITCMVFSPYLAAANDITTTLAYLTQQNVSGLADSLEAAFPDEGTEDQVKQIRAYADQYFMEKDESALFNLTALLSKMSGHFNTLNDNLKTSLTGKMYNLPGEKGDGNASGENTIGKPGSLQVILFDKTPVPGISGFTSGLDKFQMGYLLQTKMLLAKAKMNYLQVDSVTNADALQTTAVLLKRLVKRLEFVNTKVDDNSAAAAVIKVYQPLYNEANSYLRQFSKGQDYYGYGYNTVPLVSLAVYNDALARLVNNFRDIEQAYANYMLQLNDQNQTRANIAQMKSSAGQVITEAGGNVSTLENMMDLAAQNIAAYEGPLASKKAYLEMMLENVQSDMKQYFQFPDGFELFSNVVSALSQVAFMPESSFMVGVQGAGTVANMINSFKQAGSSIPNDLGQQVNKDYLIEQVAAVTDGVKNLKEGFSQLDDGTIAPDDPGASKILMEEDQVMKILNNFQQSLPDDIKAVQQAFDDYIQTIVARNTLIIKYNAIIDVLIKNLSQIQSARDAIDKANEIENDDLDPMLPEVVNIVGDIFQRSRDQVLQVAYEASRALQFWSLSNTNFFAQSLGIGTGQGGMSPSSITFEHIQNSYENVWLNALSNFSTNPTPFPNPNVPNLPGAIIRFSDTALIDTLKREGTVMLSIPPIRKGMALPPQWVNSVLHNQANIRLTNVNVWLDGAVVLKSGTPTDGLISITIVHQGAETLVSPQNVAYHFNHSPVTKTFEYYNESRKVEVAANFGEINTDDNDAQVKFALLGPFTNWLITIEGLAATQTTDLAGAVAENRVSTGDMVQLNSVKYTVSDILKQDADTILTVTLFGLPKTYTVRNNQVLDKNNMPVDVALLIVKADPDAAHVDISGLKAIELELAGTFYTFI